MESRYDDGESRRSSYFDYNYSNGGESRENYSSYHETDCNSGTNIQYNNLEDIDALISRLEASTRQINDSGSSRYNQAIQKRKNQIETLKRLRNEAQRKIEDEKKVREIERENESIDEIIASLKKSLK